jgi:membrane protease YdiL (CAAX protease family)
MTSTSPQTQGAPEALLPDSAVSYRKGLRSITLRILIAIVLFQAISATFPRVLEAIFGADLLQGSLSWLPYTYFFFVVPIFLLVRGKKMFTEDLTTTNKRIKLSDFVGLFALDSGVGAVVICVTLVLVLVLQAMGLSLPSGVVPSLEFDPMSTLFIVIIGPICEEIMFRGAILRALQPYGENFAIVISALLFGLIHGYLFQATNAFFAGLIFAYCALHFSIKWAMLLHIISNGLVAVSTYATAFGFTGSMLVLAIRGIFLVAGIVAFILLFKKLRQQRAEGKAPELSHPTETGAVLARPRPFATAFTSPWFAILLLLLVGQSLFLLISSLSL